MWTTNDIPGLGGKTALVTGANTGIGYEIGKALYKAGADVTLAGRNAGNLEAAAAQIRTEVNGNGTLATGILNLGNLGQIQRFAENFKAENTKLDILIHNAGVMIPPPSLTDDGYELQFGVNFIGHFALTAHLFPLLKEAPEGRVVTLSSGAATLVSTIDFDNLKLEKPYEEWTAYAVSKLADILFAYELNRRVQAKRLNIISTAAHPGVTRTSLQRHIPHDVLDGMLAQYPEIMEPWQGALPALFAATDRTVSGGKFYGPDGDKEYAGYPALSKHSTPAMNDASLAAKLWDYAERVTTLKFNF
ncbi:SDR family NAD(P)-dependent oxidoreductase [Mucilaginibacter sp. HME9299]|uniref:SDR family NAD(P)-dependent oxidoreductase n=2 Tax=Mucilaginibacter aquatilis TaxID=1517760 RepID=A0A6I4ICX5_9SPHI|nr:SDR family NAD(P)-dependent oxidoreductase [Mucilaginibacter aquatilis]